ncbi:hypothetical protein B2G88_18950 [Natronolimnobius baerhuensis]|uniref:Uncharacterized protein n=2 Tax=Natronolimnobius baerhuensis TaxID=253108 RepID=A0A202E4N0_9EURY|nr:hypothetical protein B2G88_18950 [Natronolimnobius baerhuensis]
MSNTPATRRTVLKVTGASLATAVVAGCLGDDDDETAAENGDDGTDTDAGSNGIEIDSGTEIVFDLSLQPILAVLECIDDLTRRSEVRFVLHKSTIDLVPAVRGASRTLPR